MNKLYKDKEWLEKKYNKEKLSDLKIAKSCNMGTSSIGYWRSKFNIKTRSRAERGHLVKANHCNLSSEAIEWINGELLGDGGVYSYSNYSAQFSYSSSKEKYIEYIRDTLNSFGIKQSGNVNENYHKEMNCYTYHYASLSYAELLLIRKKWYHQGKKIVPRDLKLTPLICRQWYIGDGSLGNPTTTGLLSITLYTCGFPISDVEWLKEELAKLGFKSTREPSENTIHISTKSTKDFLNYIGPCPVQCYQYKWNYYKKEVS